MIDARRLGFVIGDVSGKGTSAALYMAELKGLVLALSQRYDSPRALLGTAHVKAGELIPGRLLSPLEIQSILEKALA